MPKMNVMDTVVRVMESEGVDVVFGVPGAAILPLNKALGASSISTSPSATRRAATHAADGYARVTGKVGVNIGTSGPAGSNMITGLYTAMAAGGGPHGGKEGWRSCNPTPGPRRWR